MSARPDERPGADLTQVYDRWKTPLLKFLQRRLGNGPDAEDAAQETFTRLAAAGYMPVPEKRRSYLYRIAVNLLRDHGREHQARGFVKLDSLDEESMDPSALATGAASCPVNILQHRERLVRLEQALAELPERQREAFVLHRFDGLTQDEVAERMRISRRMVVKHLSRAFAYCELRLQYASVEQMAQHAPAEDEDA